MVQVQPDQTSGEHSVAVVMAVLGVANRVQIVPVPLQGAVLLTWDLPWLLLIFFSVFLC